MLRTRVAELERTMRSSRQVATNSTFRSQANEFTQLKREQASLQRAHEQLASKVASAQNKTSSVPGELTRLQQKMDSLENTVHRLESRR